jgi:hypothetical protein
VEDAITLALAPGSVDPYFFGCPPEDRVSSAVRIGTNNRHSS